MADCTMQLTWSLTDSVFLINLDWFHLEKTAWWRVNSEIMMTLCLDVTSALEELPVFIKVKEFYSRQKANLKFIQPVSG